MELGCYYIRTPNASTIVIFNNFLVYFQVQRLNKKQIDTIML